MQPRAAARLIRYRGRRRAAQAARLKLDLDAVLQRQPVDVSPALQKRHRPAEQSVALLIPATEQRMFGGIFTHRRICTAVQGDLHARRVNGLNLLRQRLVLLIRICCGFDLSCQLERQRFVAVERK